MHAYLRPAGINGLRFNSRLAKANKASWPALKAQRLSDLGKLKSVKAVLNSRGTHTELLYLGMDIALIYDRDEYEVRERGTHRLIGYVSRAGVIRC